MIQNYDSFILGNLILLKCNNRESLLIILFVLCKVLYLNECHRWLLLTDIQKPKSCL